MDAFYPSLNISTFFALNALKLQTHTIGVLSENIYEVYSSRMYLESVTYLCTSSKSWEGNDWPDLLGLLSVSRNYIRTRAD